MLDVDRLKPINDAFGHAAGDQVLKAIAATLTRQVRSSDVVGRLGGDEFALLLWNLSETDARAKAAVLEQAIDRLTFISAAAPSSRAHPRVSRCWGRSGSRPRAGRGRPRDVCAQGAAAARGRVSEARNRLSKPAQIVRHVAEFPQQSGVPEFADHRIASAAEGDRADMAGAARQDSARRSAVVELWHSSAAPATGEPTSSCRKGIAT